MKKTEQNSYKVLKGTNHLKSRLSGKMINKCIGQNTQNMYFLLNHLEEPLLS